MKTEKNQQRHEIKCYAVTLFLLNILQERKVGVQNLNRTMSHLQSYIRIVCLTFLLGNSESRELLFGKVRLTLWESLDKLSY